MNDINILPPNRDFFTGYFAKWSNNSVEIAPTNAKASIIRYVLPAMVNNNISSEFAAQSDADTDTNAMIIKGVPLTFVNDIQALVLFNKNSSQNRAIGSIIELYNSVDDPNLVESLGTTAVIDEAVSIYRYNFPSIGKYGSYFVLSSADMISNIVSDTLATKTDTTLFIFEPAININSKIVLNDFRYQRFYKSPNDWRCGNKYSGKTR